MYGKALSEIRVVAVLMKKISNYCGEDFTGFFKYASNNTEINLGTHAIDFRNFVELETGFYITDSDWINTGIFTWGKLVEHLNKGVYNITPLVEDEEGFELAMKRSRDILVSFKVPEDNSWYDLGKITGFSIKCKTPVEKPYNPVKNISYNKFKRCAAGLEVNLIQGVDDTLFMYGSDCGKYYYWEDYNCNNELIYFRGEKSWVEDNYTESGSDILRVVMETKKGLDGCFKKEDTSPNITDKVDQVINRIEGGWGKVNWHTVTIPEADDFIKTSDVERFEKVLSDYVEDNNLNMSVKELVCGGTIKGDILKAKKELDPSPIKSDGGKSDYYKIELPQWVLDKHSEKGFIMLEDLAEIMFENDFNFTNVFKAQKRMFELTKGQGKEGNDFEYDATKCKYYTDKQVEVFNRNKK